MAESKNMLDALVQAQSKSVENLMETSQKMRESFGKEDAIQLMLKMMQEWYKKQEIITQEMSASIKDQVITDKTPDFVKQLLEQQEKFSQQWKQAFQDMTKNYSGESLLQSYKENAEKFFVTWKKAYDQFAGMFTNSFGLENYDPATQAKEMHDKFVENATKYIQALEGAK